MKTIIAILIPLVLLTTTVFCQVGINGDNSAPSPSAMLDVKSANKGFLPPRMTTNERNAITGPAEGLVIYNLDEKALNVYNGTYWTPMAPSVCGQSIKDPRDGKIYQTILIGTQCWFKQNLNVGTRHDAGQFSLSGDTLWKMCYNNLESNCNVYGGLYTWSESMRSDFTPGSQGICPTGWHLPSEGEWNTLKTQLGGDAVAGGKMKETGYTHWASPNTGATNSSGFTALPAGEEEFPDFFSSLTYSAGFWSSTYGGSMFNQGPLRCDLQHNAAAINCHIDWTGLVGSGLGGLSVRCIQN